MERELSQLNAVLPDVVHEDIKLVEMFAVEVCDKKQASTLLRQLNELYPIPELGHLKRVKSASLTDGLKVLITPVNHQELQSFVEKLRTCLDFSGLGHVSVVQVCQAKPITRCQYEAAAKHWPTHFHEDKRLEKALRGELFSEKELSSIKAFLYSAATVARDIDLFDNKCKVDGAVIVDPLTNTIVGRGYTDLTHPLKHAVMVAIDSVAIEQGGGAWNTGKTGLLQTDVDEVNPQLGDASGEEQAACLHGAHKASPTEVTPSQVDVVPIEEPSKKPHSKEPILEADVEIPEPKRLKKSTQYLCTGYDLYTTKEPCIMCSMALVHSRIGRVFYCKPDKDAGGLGSKCKIHLQEGLNHHFSVYRVQFS